MNKVYYLKTCSTCTRIMKELKTSETNFELQNIKNQKITKEQVEELFSLSHSYEALLNKRSQKYKAYGLKDKKLSEEEIKNYILKEYTFLKRPVFIIDNQVFIGNSKKNIEALKEILNK